MMAEAKNKTFPIWQTSTNPASSDMDPQFGPIGLPKAYIPEANQKGHENAHSKALSYVESMP